MTRGRRRALGVPCSLMVATWVVAGLGAFAAAAAATAAKATVASETQAGGETRMPAPYDPTGRRDPFQPYARALDRPAPTGQITPLEQYDLSQLRLVAIISERRDPAKARALVEDSSGLGYIITVGTPIGHERGRVTSIERDRIVVEQWPENAFGETQRVVVVKELDAGQEAKR